MSTNGATRHTSGAWHPLFPPFLLRTEGAALLILSTLAFFQLGGSWILFFRAHSPRPTSPCSAIWRGRAWGR